MVGCPGVFFHDPAGDDLIAVRAGEDGGEHLGLAALVGHAEHIGGIGAVVLGDGGPVQLLLGDAEVGHIAVVDVDLAVQDGLDILGEELHDLHALALGHAHGKDLGIVHQVPIVLNDVAPEFLHVQRTVFETLDKGFFVIPRPDVLCCVQQPFHSAHAAPPSFIMDRRMNASGRSDTIKMLKIPSGSREERL